MTTYKNFQINKWLYYNFKNMDITNDNLHKTILIPSVLQFNHDVIIPLIEKGIIKENFRINIICKAFNGVSYKSIITLQTLEVKDIMKLTDIILGHYITLHADNYIALDFKELTFNFRILSEQFNRNIKPKISPVEEHINFKDKPYTQKISNVNIPLTMDLYQWEYSNISFNAECTKGYMTIGELEYHFNIKDDHYICEITTLNDDKIIIFKDTLLKPNQGDLTYFTREIINRGVVEKLYIHNNWNTIFKCKTHKPSFLKKANKADHLSVKLITWDIETKLYNGKMRPICISMYDGKVKKSFKLTEGKSHIDIINEFIQHISRPKFNGFKFHAQNFSGFDSIFLLKYLVKTCEVKVIIREGTLIEVKCKISKYNTIKLRDSYLMLPTSLDSLGKNFLNSPKQLFPYEFVNQNDLNYEGAVPDIKYFNNISEYEYNVYKSSFEGKSWNLMTEVVKYCESDVDLLYKVIRKFAARIYSLYQVDVLDYPTLPSLALGIYRTNYLNENWKIPLIVGGTYKFISQSYSGGHVDLYIHSNNEEDKVYRYDVNSLYPYSMLNNPMPVGNPIEFEGNILDNEIYNIVCKSLGLKERYGFFDCDIEAPKDLHIPVLLKRMKLDTVGYRTLAPVGKWSGVYHSHELMNAAKYGYKYTCNKGYLFNTQNIFKSFIEDLYAMKKDSEIGGVDYIISKLLMNALYGRFGMNPEIIITSVLNINDLDKYIQSDKIQIYDKLDLDDEISLVSYVEKKEETSNRSSNVNVAIASSITAYSRIYMSKFKHLNDYKVFYSDTDSIDLNKPLPSEYVGRELGQLKLEHIWEKVIYISNKAYLGIDANGEAYRKIRGVKMNSKEFKSNTIEMADFEKLLFKDSELLLNQERWYKSFKDATIETKEIIYKLQSNDNKRISLYVNGKKSYTKPIEINP